MPDITNAKGTDLMRYGLFGATGYDTNNKLVGYVLVLEHKSIHTMIVKKLET